MKTRRDEDQEGRRPGGTKTRRDEEEKRRRETRRDEEGRHDELINTFVRSS